MLSLDVLMACILDDVVLLDSGVVCPAVFIYLYAFLSCRVMLYIPVVENPAATRVRVSCAGGV